jgi:hypothetical protein
VLVDVGNWFLDSQLALALIFGFQLLYSLDEVWLLEASIAGLVPVAEDLLEVANLELLQIDCVEVDLFVWRKEKAKVRRWFRGFLGKGHVPYLRSQIWTSFFLSFSQILSAGIDQLIGLAISPRIPVADSSKPPR